MNNIYIIELSKADSGYVRNLAEIMSFADVDMLMFIFGVGQ